MTKLNEKYFYRIKGFSNEFIGDVLATTIRIDRKDGKAYGLRIFRSVSKRFGGLWHYKVYLVLNWLEYRGLLVSTLETTEEFQARCEAYKGVLKRGKRRKYYSLNPGLPSDKLGKIKELTYKKLNWKDLGMEENILWDYPVK